LLLNYISWGHEARTRLGKRVHLMCLYCPASGKDSVCRSWKRRDVGCRS
jgi:hypothetical protein